MSAPKKQKAVVVAKKPIKIASFDIGVKNLAFCVMTYDPSKPSGEQFPIEAWRSMDITDQHGRSEMSCNKIKPSGEQCTNGPKIFLEDGGCFCGVHNPDRKKYKPEKQTGAKTKNLSYEKLGNMLMDRLDELSDLWDNVDHIILEKQFNKNRRMIFLSAIIFAYFINNGQRNKKSKVTSVKFVSATNKLKIYDGPPVTLPKRKNPKDTRKLTAIKHCEYFIRGDEPHTNYLKRFPKKKDDLSDCFLQGAWYLLNECKGTNRKKKAKV